MKRVRPIDTKNCPQCKKVFSRTSRPERITTYCSFECSKIYRTKLENLKICVRCNKDFRVRGKRKNHAIFCSLRCQFPLVPEHSCPQCNRIIPSVKKSQYVKFCSEKCRLRYMGEHWKDWHEKSGAFGRRWKLTEKQRLALGLRFLGRKGPNWKGGISKERDRDIHSAVYRRWRYAVVKRDGLVCQICRISKESNLKEKFDVDHIKSYALYPEVRYDITNGRVLCHPCHLKTPNYGFRKENRLTITEGWLHVSQVVAFISKQV